MNIPRIHTYCHIKNRRTIVNGNLIYENQQREPAVDFLKDIFKKEKINYPKFYKMDEISKLGFLAAELLLKTNITADYLPEDIGIILSNSQSTLATDEHFQKSVSDYQNFYPSPSVFVYTLPNIMIGEISIRHQFRGENAFFIFEKFNAAFMADYMNQLFLSKKMKACIGGWVEFSENEYEAFMYFATQSDKVEGFEHNEFEINRLYLK